jgi:hypothetical protein
MTNETIIRRLESMKRRSENFGHDTDRMRDEIEFLLEDIKKGSK